MKFKLDENLSPNSDLFAVCIREQRCLVTLDLDFADVTRFPPHEAAGIAVLRSPRPITPAVLRTLLRGLVDALQHEKIDGRLWIVEPGRIRVHAETAPDADGP